MLPKALGKERQEVNILFFSFSDPEKETAVTKFSLLSKWTLEVFLSRFKNKH